MTRRPRGGGGSAADGSPSSSRRSSDIILVQVNQQKGSLPASHRGPTATTGVVAAGSGDPRGHVPRLSNSRFEASPMGRDVALPATEDDLSETSRSSQHSRRSARHQRLRRSCSNCGEVTSRPSHRMSDNNSDPDAIHPAPEDLDETDESMSRRQ